MVKQARKLGYEGFAGAKPSKLITVDQLADYEGIFSDQQMAEENISAAYKAFDQMRRNLNLSTVRSEPIRAGFLSYDFWRAKGEFFKSRLPETPRVVPQAAQDMLERLNTICKDHGIDNAFTFITWSENNNNGYVLVPNTETREEAEKILIAVAERVPGLYAQVKHGVDVETHTAIALEDISKGLADAYQGSFTDQTKRFRVDAGKAIFEYMKHLADKNFQGNTEAARRHISDRPEVLKAVSDAKAAGKSEHHAGNDAYQAILMRGYLEMRGVEEVDKLDIDTVKARIGEIQMDDAITTKIQEYSDNLAAKLEPHGIGISVARNGSDLKVSMSTSENGEVTFSLDGDLGLKETGIREQTALVDAEQDWNKRFKEKKALRASVARQIIPVLLETASYLTHDLEAPKFTYIHDMRPSV